MAATSATVAATPAAAVAATPLTAGPVPPPTIPEKCLHKNHLQEFAQKTHKKLPIYKVEMEGEYHLPKFRCTVNVGGQLFSSTGSFNRRKEAEQDAARVAYEALVTKGEDDVSEVLGLIDQDVVFCKSILHEFAVKTKVDWPSYSVIPVDKPMTLFVASVVFDGNTYTGEAGVSKKDAQQKAASSVIKSILATHNTCMMGIIKSKKDLIAAIKSSRNTKDIGSTFRSIKFTPAVECTEHGLGTCYAKTSKTPQHRRSFVKQVLNAAKCLQGNKIMQHLSQKLNLPRQFLFKGTTFYPKLCRLRKLQLAQRSARAEVKDQLVIKQ